MPLPKITIEARVPAGDTRVLIDGEEVDGLIEYKVEQNVDDQWPRVTFTVIADKVDILVAECPVGTVSVVPVPAPAAPTT